MECWLAWLFFICVVVFVLDIGRLILSDSVCFALYFLTYWVLYACFSLLDFSFVWLISLFWWFAYDCALSISYACVFCWIFNILHKFCMFNFACLVLVVGSECLFLYIYSRFCILIWSSVCVLSFGWILHTPFCALVLVSLRNCPADATFLIVYVFLALFFHWDLLWLLFVILFERWVVHDLFSSQHTVWPLFFDHTNF